MEETQSVNTAVNGLLRTVRNQLNNTLSLVEAQAKAIDESLKAETQDYNELCDQLEKRDQDILTLNLKLQNRSELSKEEEQELKKELTGLRNKLATANLALSNIPTLEAELKKLQAMNPERLNKKVKELRKTLEEKTRLLSSTSTKFKDANKELNSLRSLNSQLSLDNTNLIGEIEKHRERLRVLNGDDVRKTYAGGDGLEANISIFDWGLTYRATSIEADMLNDLTWHMEVRLNIGLGVIVSITKWLSPFFPHVSTEIQENWPKDINAAMARIIIDKCQMTHPHLVDRVDWASAKLLSELNINEKHLKILEEAGFTSLYSVVSTPVERLPNLLKGMGDKSCKQLMEVCNEAVKQWESENWTPEERKMH